MNSPGFNTCFNSKNFPGVESKGIFKSYKSIELTALTPLTSMGNGLDPNKSN